MPNIELEELYARYIAGLNARDFETVATLIAENVRMNGAPTTRGDVVASLQGIVDAVPDFTWVVEDLFTDENRIAARLRDTGTPEKPFLGHEPTGASLDIMEYGSYRIADGCFAEMWFLIDAAGAGQQLRGKTAAQR